MPWGAAAAAIAARGGARQLLRPALFADGGAVGPGLFEAEQMPKSHTLKSPAATAAEERAKTNRRGGAAGKKKGGSFVPKWFKK